MRGIRGYSHFTLLHLTYCLWRIPSSCEQMQKQNVHGLLASTKSCACGESIEPGSIFLCLGNHWRDVMTPSHRQCCPFLQHYEQIHFSFDHLLIFVQPYRNLQIYVTLWLAEKQTTLDNSCQQSMHL